VQHRWLEALNRLLISWREAYAKSICLAWHVVHLELMEILAAVLIRELDEIEYCSVSDLNTKIDS
jgi:hypothetical protein